MALGAAPQRMLMPTNRGQVPASGRVGRHPKHRFYARTAPWCIQPLAIAPVIPGETLENAHFEGRVVTDPLNSKLLGWTCEFHVFYVKHRDIDYQRSATSWQDVMLGHTTVYSGAGTVAGGGKATYRLNGRPDMVKECLDVIVQRWFRDEGETASQHTNALNGLPLQKLGVQDWTDSFVSGSVVSSPTGDFAVDLDTSGVIKASEIERSMEMWEWLKQNNWTDMSYEDFLGTYGVRQPRVQEHFPELLRSFRSWTYPSNTVSQGTGAVSSAAVWSPEFSINKARFFSEPGFLVLVGIAKPKVYRRKQTGAAVNQMTTAFSWLPAVLRDNPETSQLEATSITGAIGSITINGGIQSFDCRDLLLYGDQYLAATPSVAGGDSVAAAGAWSVNGGSAYSKAFGVIDGVGPTDGRPDYPLGTLAERTDLFAGTVNETTLIEFEGLIQFHVRGTVVDQTPGQPIRA